MGFVKCNIDVFFFSASNQVGIGMCLRNEFSHFLGARTRWFKMVIDVHMGGATGLYFAINWMKELNYHKVIFELNSKL